MGNAGFLLVGERGQRPFFPLSDLNLVEEKLIMLLSTTHDAIMLVLDTFPALRWYLAQASLT
jgi:hypothetical protein